MCTLFHGFVIWERRKPTQMTHFFLRCDYKNFQRVLANLDNQPLVLENNKIFSSDFGLSINLSLNQNRKKMKKNIIIQKT